MQKSAIFSKYENDSPESIEFRRINAKIKNLNKHPKSVYFVLGKNDDIIKANDNISWIIKNKNNINEITVKLLNFGHRVPIEIFSNEINCYYNQL